MEFTKSIARKDAQALLIDYSVGFQESGSLSMAHTDVLK